ncbi:MAG: murein L,D-transpeptidase catalytic domain family protein [Deltaproteobacteria bacterium]|nr:murein L,D-transpeptidase catalytic domain family protein [Deltaproteobacteria bacterium]
MWIRTLVTCGVLTVGACAGDPDELGTSVSSINLADFVLPSLSATERAPIVRKYDLLDHTDVIPRGLLEDALVYFDVNKAHIPMTGYLAVVDLSLYSGMDRFWLVDLATGSVEPHKVAHGDGTDPDNDGYATLFGNVEGSHKSSLGFYLTGEIYDGTHAHSMRLDGLSIDGSPNGMANTNARERLIVMHEASYVDDANTSQQGRSNGCLALDPEIEVGVVDRIHDGSLIYSATQPLAALVGRASCGDATCDGGETDASCPEDCVDDPRSGSGTPDPEPSDDEVGGCSTSGSGAGSLFAMALVGVGLRRRRSRSSRG